LNISKKIATGLGGDLTLNEGPNIRGSEFEFKIKALTKPEVLQSTFKFKRVTKSLRRE
jgi:signal transduction histidine kinase